MRFTINTNILAKENLTLGEFLIMLLGYHNVNYEECRNKLIATGIVEPNLFDKTSVILSDNTENKIAKILVESDAKMDNCGIEDFEELAKVLQSYFPKGNKADSTHSWRGTTEEIAQKLRTLIVKHNFYFTEHEAITAVSNYVSSFRDYRFMHTLKNFILVTHSDKYGHRDIDSMFMTIIENNREHETDT